MNPYAFEKNTIYDNRPGAPGNVMLKLLLEEREATISCPVQNRPWANGISLLGIVFRRYQEGLKAILRTRRPTPEERDFSISMYMAGHPHMSYKTGHTATIQPGIQITYDDSKKTRLYLKNGKVLAKGFNREIITLTDTWAEFDKSDVPSGLLIDGFDNIPGFLLKTVPGTNVSVYEATKDNHDAGIIAGKLYVSLYELESKEERLVRLRKEPKRFEAILGPNTNQLWIYDNDLDQYCDPPASALSRLKELEKLGIIDSVEEEQRLLEEMAFSEKWAWDRDHRYNDIEI